ncbi:MAG: alpha/beta hydrolase [Deltaproteobacteria bacterium]|nr:alpha/beta hydrolase [Deltaproteobacteria bacterium]
MKRIAMAILILALLMPATVFAGGSKSSTTCATKYPVVLAHGMGASAQVLGIVDYWWGIESALEDRGANVYVTSVNAMDSVFNKAASFKAQFLHILAVTGKAKANIIAHSQGVLYTRYAISNMGLGPQVATLTSIAGPNRGSYIANLIVYKIPSSLVTIGGKVLDFVYSFLLGDKNPQSVENGMELCTDWMADFFNVNVPNVSGVYYQSWASKVKIGCPNLLLNATWLILLNKEGANDGMVSVNSAKWGAFRGVQEAAWYSPGCDHLTIIGQLFGLTPGFSAPDFFVSVVSDLKNKGY